MYKNKSVCVVVPAHNEATQIGQVLETMPDYIDGIVVIDQTIRVGACERVAGERHGRAAQGRDRGFGGLGINCHGAIIASWDSAANDPARPLIETAVEGVMGPSEIRGK